jgi:hypothetical protein
VIGARPNFEDSHIWDPIAEARAQVWFIGGPTDFEELRDRASGRAVHVADTFAEGLADLEQKLRIPPQ